MYMVAMVCCEFSERLVVFRSGATPLSLSVSQLECCELQEGGGEALRETLGKP